VRHARILIGTLALALCPASAHAAGLIAPAQLVAHVRDLPGFAGARETRQHTTSPFAWAHETSPGTWTEAQLEATNLQALGFEEGAEAFFTGRAPEVRGLHREAVSQAVVFATAAAAQSEVMTSVQGALRLFPRAGLLQGADPAIPGAVTLGSFRGGHRGGSDNVFFSTGRCFFVIGNAVHAARTRAAADRAPLVAALALYRRDQGLCV
jgi:hypothetical protein